MVRRKNYEKGSPKKKKSLTVVSYGENDAKVVSSNDEEVALPTKKGGGVKIISKGKFAERRLALAQGQPAEQARASGSPRSPRQGLQGQQGSPSSPDSSSSSASNDSSNNNNNASVAVSSTPRKRPAASSGRRNANVSQTPRKRPRKSLPPTKVVVPKKLPIRKGENKALAEIRYYQHTTGQCLSKLPFQRLVRELTEKITGIGDLRYASQALEVLQESTEIFLTGLFEDSYLLTMHARRVTLQPHDMTLASRLRKN